MEQRNLTATERHIANKVGAREQDIALELQLAELLGYIDPEVARSGQLVGGIPGERGRTHLPRWARDNGAAYRIMVKNQLSVTYMGGTGEKGERRAASDQTRLRAITYTGEHGGNEEATVRAVIVQGAICKLEAEIEANNTLKNPNSSPSIG